MAKPLPKHELEPSNLDRKKHIGLDENAQIESLLLQWRKEVRDLTYEESLRILNLILSELQNDSIPVSELQSSYLRGKIYLEHCQHLLNQIEAEVLSFNPETLDLESFRCEE